MITLILPYPPSLNRLYRMGKGRWYMESDGKNYKESVYYLVRLLKLKNLPLVGRLNVEVGIYPPDRRKRDIDGICKVLLDAMQDAGVYENDCQIKRLLLTMCECEDKKGRIEVTILPLDGQ